ncbi:MAG: LysM peptidoglycan-binding domain-containing protein, partial [Bacteriovoracaceae bacterium]|nr:LysM peptidoglycan-binding domain-containing protein [Bacteriovoracaceae bacterium]
MKLQKNFWPKVIPITFILFSSVLWAGEWYIVQQGDTLSDIVSAHTKRHKSLYGENGRLALVIAANTDIKDPDRIEIGQKIYLASVPLREIASIAEDNPTLAGAKIIPVSELPESVKTEMQQTEPQTELVKNETPQTAPQTELVKNETPQTAPQTELVKN